MRRTRLRQPGNRLLLIFRRKRRLVCFVISSLQVGIQFTAWSGIREQRHLPMDIQSRCVPITPLSETLREKFVNIGAKIVRHGRYVTFQMAAVTVPSELFQKMIDGLQRRPAPA